MLDNNKKVLSCLSSVASLQRWIIVWGVQVQMHSVQTNSYIGLNWITLDYIGLHWITVDYIGLGFLSWNRDQWVTPLQFLVNLCQSGNPHWRPWNQHCGEKPKTTPCSTSCRWGLSRIIINDWIQLKLQFSGCCLLHLCQHHTGLSSMS